MLYYKIPGRGELEIENLVLDYNGTIAVDGKLIEGVEELLAQLKEYVNIYVLTADTYGTVEEELKDLDVKVLTFPNHKAGASKQQIVMELGGHKTICIGNGYIDLPMFKESILSIAVIEEEGAYGKLLYYADIVTHSILDALKIVLNSDRVRATLRN
ncbi:MAG: ATPase P [Tissierellia bacterium]|nr:ATPase P [Tissierellia bacterium]